MEKIAKEADEDIFFDFLTGLPDMEAFRMLSLKKLTDAGEKGEKAAVLYLNLDNIRLFNELLGRLGGNCILNSVGKKLKPLMEESELAGYIGGDKFVFLKTAECNSESAARFAVKILDIFNSPFVINSKEFFITGSIGISVFPYDGVDLDLLLKQAKAAMHNAGRLGKNKYYFYSKGLKNEMINKLKLENSLRNAVWNNEFSAYYQPQIDLNTNRIECMEALVRWKHPEKGIILPGKFIPLAEETGLIWEIGEIVLRKACSYNKSLQRLGIAPLRVAVNLSTKQFEQEDLFEVILDILDETGLDPRWLVLEVTESTIMRNPDFSVKVLNKFKDKGIRIALDDFGTGYSCLYWLKRLPIDILKIDRSFIENVTGNVNDRIIYKTIIELAHKMDLTVIAEGVETTGQLNFLINERCDKVQGFLYSKPVSSREFLKLLK